MAQHNRISIVIKPTNACNLRCKYCYNNYDNYSRDRMDIATYARLLEVLSKDYTYINFIWHGGEPLLMGINFYEQCLDLQEKYKSEHSLNFTNSIQTNATLIDDAWCAFFLKHSFKVGISFDGPPFGISGRGGTADALKAMDCLKSNGISFGAIAVINRLNIEYINQIYDFFCTRQIPVNLNCVFDAGNIRQGNSHMLISGEEYFEAYKTLFDKWIVDESVEIAINPFKQILETIILGPKLCENSGCLYRFLAVTSNGELYPCGRLSSEDTLLGSVFDFSNIKSVFDCERYNYLVHKAIDRRKSCVAECSIYKFCNGGCNANALIGGDIAKNNFLQCQGYKQLLLYIKERYDRMVADNQISPKVAKIMERRRKL